MFDWFIGLVNDALDWGRAFWFDVVDAVYGGLATLLEAIPAPAFLVNATGYAMPAEVSWVLSAFEVEFGVSVYVAALTLRFVLRRIPGIG